MNDEKLKILIVDDDLTEAESCKCVLETIDDFDIQIETDSRAASKKLLAKSDEVDLLVLDLNMPNVSGIEIIQTLQKNNVFVPIIIYSSYINSYTEEINKSNIISAIDKNIIEEQFTNNIIEIFTKLNMLKSCMLIDSRVQSIIRKEENKIKILDSLNEIKNQISMLAASM